MKTLKDFTPEVQAKIPEYIKNALAGVFDGGRYKSFDIEKAKKAVWLNYERCGYKKPVVLVAGNPYEAQIIMNYLSACPPIVAYIYLLYCLQNKIKNDQLRGRPYDRLLDQLRDQLHDRLDDQLYDQLHGQLDGQLYDQLHDRLRGQLDDQLHDQLYGQLDVQLRDQLRGQLDVQLDGQLYDQLLDRLRGQLDVQLYGQLYDQLHDRLDDRLYVQLRHQLRGQLDDQLHDQLGGQLNDLLDGQLRSQLRDQLRDLLDGQLGDQLDGQLRDQLDGQLHDQLDGQLRDQLDGQLRDQLYGRLNGQLRDQLYGRLNGQLRHQLHDQLRGQLDGQKIKYFYQYLFTLNVWSLAYYSYYKFIANELGVKAKINADLEIFSSLYEQSNIYNAIFSELVCVVSKYPKIVRRDSENRLHCTTGPAVEWEYFDVDTNFVNYYLHGRYIPKNIAEVALNGELTRDLFVKEQNDEFRSAWYVYMGEERMMTMLGAREIDRIVVTHHNDEQEVITLYRTKERLNKIKNKPYAWLKRICPSTGTAYLTPTNPDFESALDAAKFHRPDFVPTSLGYIWYSRS